MSVRASERNVASACDPRRGSRRRTAESYRVSPPPVLELIENQGTEAWLWGVWEELWSPTTLRSWSASMTLHGLLLLTLALWYFAPPLKRPISFDSRLAGSPKGVPEGLTLTGGMNTPLAMPDVPDNQIPAPDEPLTQLLATSLEPAADQPGSRRQAKRAVAASPTTIPAPVRAMASAWPASAREASSFAGSPSRWATRNSH